MQAIILAGGFGTRLQSIVKDVPKPMATIDKKPFLAYILQYLQQQGFKSCIISVGYLQEKIISYFGDIYLGMKISYAIEDEPLGTGGAILNALKHCNKLQPVFVLNGDSFLKINYRNLLNFHIEQKSQITIALKAMENCSRYGLVEINQEKNIVKFDEKKPQQKSGLINGGIYVFDPKIFAEFSLMKKFSFEKDFLEQKIDKIDLKGFVNHEYFIDIGIPEDYQKAQNELPKIIKNKALFLDRDGVINIDHGYVYKKESFEFIDGIFDLCKAAQDLGYLIIIATNQAGIAKGFYTEEQFFDLTKWMEKEFLKRNIFISKVFYCPYHIDAKIEKYRKDSQDRKPNSGMFLKAIEEFNIDQEQSIMIGDNQTDISAAAGAKIDCKLLFDSSKQSLKSYIQFLK